MVAGRRAELLEEAVTSLRALSRYIRILAVKTEVIVEKDIEDLFREIQKTFGRAADVVLASAGRVSGPVKVGQGSMESWWKDYVHTNRHVRLVFRADTIIGD